MSSGTWQSWSGLEQAEPVQQVSPADAGEVADAVRAARSNGLTAKMVGSGHSFTGIAVAPGLLLRPDRLVGVTGVDRQGMTVTVLAGTPLHELNRRLDALGLALHNLGDVDRQTVAGAISTGTHGSGGRWASLSAQVAALELVLADGTIVQTSPEREPELFEAGRLGLGAVGILTSVTFRVEPAFLLEADERPITWGEIVSDLDELTDKHHHVDLYWFPHTDRGTAKLNDRTVDEARPLSRARSYVDDDLLANRVFSGLNRLANRVPRAVPTLNGLATRMTGRRGYVDVAHRVLVSERRVRFKEMEYAVPREAGIAALIEARRVIDRGGFRTTFPVEIRPVPADDAWLSTSHDHASVYLAFHVHVGAAHEGYFRAVEEVLVDHGGRPHWGKLHTRTVADLAPTYPRFDDFLRVRDRVDPDRVFTNSYLDRVIGP